MEHTRLATCQPTSARRTSAPRQLPGLVLIAADGRLLHLQQGADASDHLTAEEIIALAQNLAQ